MLAPGDRVQVLSNPDAPAAASDWRYGTLESFAVDVDADDQLCLVRYDGDLDAVPVEQYRVRALID